MKTSMTIKMEKTAINGKKYWNLLSFEYSSEPSQSMHIEFDGLFAGELDRGTIVLFTKKIDQ